MAKIESTYLLNSSDWSFKNKWYHYLFWVCYFFFWLFVSEYPLGYENVIVNLIFLICNIAAVYTILYFLLPKYLYRRKYLAFGLLSVFVVLLFSVILAALLYFTFKLLEFETSSFFNLPHILGPTLGSISTSVIIFLIAKLVKIFLTTQQKNTLLEHEKTQTELKFLKSQLNPHFLFNAMNNIYFLIKKDPDTAAENLAKFSDMMRYQLYECNEDKIGLQQEIEYINNYVKISSLGKAETTDIQIDTKGILPHHKISPLVLIPLVENAFKHVMENEDGQNFITISIKASEDKLICVTENSVKHNSNDKTDTLSPQKDGGLGLNNLKRRLSLMYPKNYELMVEKRQGRYYSKLELKI